MLSNPYIDAGRLAWLSPWRLIKYCLWSLQGFALGWMKTRRVPDLLWGLPAVTACVLLLSTQARSQGTLPLSVRDKYIASTERAIDAAIDAEDQATRDELVKQAGFYVQRLEEAGVTSEEFLWQRSRLDAFQGRSQRRWEDLHAIIQNHDLLRDADAHLAIAEGVLSGEWVSRMGGRDAASVIELVEHHFQSAIELDDLSRQAIHARNRLVNLNLALQRYDDARALMEQYDYYSADDRLLLAQIYQELGDEERARVQAELAIPALLQRVEEGSLNPIDWQSLAHAYVLSGECEKAVELLHRAAVTMPHAEEGFLRLTARAYVVWSSQVPEVDFSRRLQLLESAVNTFPSDSVVVDAVYLLLMSASETEETEAEARILNALADGGSPMMAHVIIGMRAALRGNADDARFHLDQALEHGGASPILLNNLAHVLAFGPDHEYEAALELVDQALLQQPEASFIHVTRGQILARLERWPEAITALETALPELPDYAPLRQTLAEAYAAVGQDDLADNHRRRLEELGGPVELDFAAEQPSAPPESTFEAPEHGDAASSSAPETPLPQTP